MRKVSIGVIANFFIIVHILYPSIANYTFSLFNCTQGPQNKLYMKSDLSLECWTSEHISLCLKFGLPLLLFWILGFPTFILLSLRRNLPRLKNKDVIKEYGLFYIGLKDSTYFWDVVISNLRKVIFIIIVTFL